MPRTSGFDYHGPSKQWVEIITSDPATQTIQGRLGDGGSVSITLGDIPTAFRWPKVGEWWSIMRDAINPTFWNLGNRVHGRTSEMQDGIISYSLSERAPIEDMDPGEARIDAYSVFDALGRKLLHEGEGGGGSGTPEVYVQPDAPVDPTPPYLWVQTDFPPGGWTLYFDDGT